MLIKKMDNQVTKTLVDYLLDKSTMFSLTEYINNTHYYRNKRIEKILLRNIDLETILKSPREVIDKLFEQYRQNKEIYRICLEEDINAINGEINEINRRCLESVLDIKNKELNNLKNDQNDCYNSKDVFESVIYWIIYQEKRAEFISKYNHKIIKKTNEINNWSEYKDKKVIHSIIYMFSLDDDTKSIVLDNPNPFSWLFPNFLEDICFYDNDRCLLLTITHEEVCDLYCESKEEWEKFKSMGIEFYEEDYTFEQYTVNNNYRYEKIGKDI